MFIESQECLEPNYKKFHLKILRAQLGTHELAIFFFNSISSLGNQAWLIDEYPNFNSNQPLINLVEKYEIIRNLPLKPFTYELDPYFFYPKTRYEWKEIVDAKPLSNYLSNHN